MNIFGGTVKPFHGVDVIEVEDGTEFKCPTTGEVHIVRDGVSISRGRKLFMTKTDAQALYDSLANAKTEADDA